MGAIVHTTADTALLSVAVSAASPIERIEVRNGREIVAIIALPRDQLGRRIRVIWSGAEYRGRFRMTTWDGTASNAGNSLEYVEPVNFFNPDRPLRREGDHRISWSSITTGNISGFDAMLADAEAGRIEIATAQGTVDLAIADIGFEPLTFQFGGLDRKLAIYRLPDRNPALSAAFDQVVPLHGGRDNPIYISAITEDGHQAWSSPIYPYRGPPGTRGWL